MKSGDWMHLNSISLLGPNKWFKKGDKRFHPANIIWSGRNTNIIGITDKKSGKIVWQLGPDYDTSDVLKKLGWIIGQHHAHLIPQGLPGEGNILIFDNGGSGGYGIPNPGAPRGRNIAIRYFSRVLEIDPVSLEIVWHYPSVDSQSPGGTPRFFSSFISSAQRMPNGNTLITEGAHGRVIEVTPNHEIVWEYVSPFFNMKRNTNNIYRAYRLPYNWVPQVKKPEEKIIPRLDNSRFRVPNSPSGKPFKVTRIR